MTEKEKCIKRVELLQKADGLLKEALSLGGHHFECGTSICDAQLHIDDAIVWADRKSNTSQKRSLTISASVI